MSTFSGGTAYSRPDWAMIGASISDGRVMILASTELGEAELQAIMTDPLLPFYDERYEPPRISHYEFRATMFRYVYVTGDTYEDALRSLLSSWTPERTRHERLPGQPALPTGDLDG